MSTCFSFYVVHYYFDFDLDDDNLLSLVANFVIFVLSYLCSRDLSVCEYDFESQLYLFVALL